MAMAEGSKRSRVIFRNRTCVEEVQVKSSGTMEGVGEVEWDRDAMVGGWSK